MKAQPQVANRQEAMEALNRQNANRMLRTRLALGDGLTITGLKFTPGTRETKTGKYVGFVTIEIGDRLTIAGFKLFKPNDESKPPRLHPPQDFYKAKQTGNSNDIFKYVILKRDDEQLIIDKLRDELRELLKKENLYAQSA